MLFRLQIGPGGLKEKKKRSSNYQKMLSIQFWGGGRRNSRLRLLVGVTGALLGASNSFLFFLLYTGFASIFSSFSIFFLFSLSLVLVTVFLTLAKSSWTTFSCQFRCENIVVTMMKFSIGFARHSSETAHATCPMPHAPCHMPPHGSASIFVRFRDSACEINFNRFRAAKKEEEENFCHKEIKQQFLFFVNLYTTFLNGENRNRDLSSGQ